MKLKIPKSLRFVVSGGTAALSKLIIFVVLFSFFQLWYLLASALAFALSVIIGFYMQKYFTFENISREDMTKQALTFVSVSGLNLLVNLGLMYLMVNIIKLNEILAQVLTIGMIACWNFFVYHKFVFRDKVAV